MNVRCTPTVSLLWIIVGLAASGQAEELKPAWRPKNILAEYRAVPGTYTFLAEVEVPEWNKKLKMLVDTGCSMTVFHQSFQTKLQSAEKTITLNGALKDLPTFRAPAMVSNSFHPKPNDGVVCMELSKFQDELEVQIDGILGMDCFLDSILHFDFDRETLLVAKRHGDDIPPGKTVTARVHHNIPRISLAIKKDVDLEFMIDSGMFGTMGLSRKLFSNLVREGAIVKSADLRTVLSIEGEKDCYQGQCSRLQFLDTIHRDLHVISDSKNMLGTFFLSRYRVTIDIENQECYFDPGRRHLQRDCSELDGVDLDGRINEEKFVAEIDEKRLAYHCGLREGDVIFQIGGQSARELNFEQTICRWMDLRATVLKLRIRREGELFDVIIRGDERLSVLNPKPVELTPLKNQEATVDSKEAGAISQKAELLPTRSR